jgi:hypothetical protein
MSKIFYISTPTVGTNLIAPYNNKNNSAYPREQADLPKDTKKLDENLKRIDDIIDNLNYMDGGVRIKKWEPMDDAFDDLRRRRHRVRSEFNSSAAWDYHNLYSRKSGTFVPAIKVGIREDTRAPPVKNFTLNISREILAGPALMPPVLSLPIQPQTLPTAQAPQPYELKLALTLNS